MPEQTPQHGNEAMSLFCGCWQVTVINDCYDKQTSADGGGEDELGQTDSLKITRTGKY